VYLWNLDEQINTMKYHSMPMVLNISMIIIIYFFFLHLLFEEEN